MLTSVIASARRFWGVSGLAQDAMLYGASACFALITSVVATSSDYRAWGAMAGIAYVIAGLVCAGFWLFERARGLRATVASSARRIVVVALIFGAVIVPLWAQLTWRAEHRPGAHAQPEVAVIERAGDRMAHNRDPYLAAPTTVGVSPSSDAKSIDATSYFPYLPGMIPFGLINALSGPPELTDARVALVGFALVVGAIALLLSDASFARRGRALQFLVVLPSGALPMVTGGDDLPVLAAMLLGLVCVAKRRPVVAGVVLGVAGTLKFTAWPLLLLLLLVVRDRAGRPAPLRYGLSVASIVATAVLFGVSFDPIAFFNNVVRFPLGLAHVRSPAASPLIGQVIVHLLPGQRDLITALLLLIGAITTVAVYRRARPHTTASAARFCAFVMALATVLAPATRFGYLIYPANLVIWAYLLEELEGSRAQPPSATSNKRSAMVLRAPVFDEGVVELEGAGATVTPSSQ